MAAPPISRGGLGWLTVNAQLRCGERANSPWRLSGRRGGASDMEATVEGLAALVDGRVVGDGHRIIREVTPLEAVRPGSLVWAGSAEALRQAEQSPAGCIVTSEEPRRSTASYIVAANSKLALAKILDHLHPRRPPQPGIARSCVLGAGVILG